MKLAAQLLTADSEGGTMTNSVSNLAAIEAQLDALADRHEAVVRGGRRLARRPDRVEAAVEDEEGVVREVSDIRDELDHGD
jgi:hypothetical protein